MEITSDYKKANAYTLKCMCVSSIVMIVAWTLNVLKIFIIDQTIMNHSLIGVFIFIVCGFLVKFALGFERPVSNYLMLFLFVGMITFVNMQLSYHVTLFMPFPMVCAVLYGRKRYARYTFALISLGFLSSVLVGYQIGLCDANMLILTTSTKANETARLVAGSFEFNSNQVFLVLFFVVPRVMAFWAFTAVLNYIMKSIQEKTLHEQESLRLAESERLANQAKSRFLAQMSHEIRTPINTVLGMNEMILHKAQDEEILDYSRSIKKSGKNLLMLINSILDFSKIEDGKMELLPVNYNMADLIEGLRISVEHRAKDKGLDFVISADPALPSELFGDDLRISQVIVNLLTNAVKYTKEGSVTLDIREESRKDDQIRLFVQVKDTGIGIREEDLPKLFTSFERLEEKKNRAIEGTGLGLSICTRLLEMMDSKLEVKSTYGEGSCFYFYLDQKIVDSTPMTETLTVPEFGETSSERTSGAVYPDARILVVDDNGMNLKVIRNLLGLFEITPDAESSGAGAIERLREKDYDIVFMDHMMPEMDGIETLAKLRKEDLVPEHTVVIALTANAIVGARKLYMDASFDDYLTKPIELGQLASVLDKYLPEEKKRSPEAMEEDEILEFIPEEDSGAGENEGNVSGEDKTAEALGQAGKIGLDTGAGLIYCGNDASFYLEMLREFVSAYPEKEKKLEECYTKEDWNNYKIHVHALKTNLASIGASETSDLARELEKAAEDGDVSVLRDKHGTLILEYGKLVTNLQNKVVR
ncbi:MAG: response regulator [Clostridiales bacterium]|nr:response regulator [Clostridiales bacterium]